MNTVTLLNIRVSKIEDMLTNNTKQTDTGPTDMYSELLVRIGELEDRINTLTDSGVTNDKQNQDLSEMVNKIITNRMNINKLDMEVSSLKSTLNALSANLGE